MNPFKEHFGLDSDLISPISDEDAYNELMSYDEKQIIINELLFVIRKVHGESKKANEKGFNVTFKYIDQELGKYVIKEK